MSPVLATAGMSRAWIRGLAGLAVLWIMLGLLYADTVSAMVWIWIRSETFAHAFLVPPISAWLVWRQRHLLARMEPLPQPLFLLALLPPALLWLVGELAVVNGAIHFAWVVMLIVSVPAVLGWRVAYQILFPLMFMLFAAPLGEFMTAPMMEWTADFTVAAVAFSGVPVYREAQNFVIPSGSWSVIEACSGVRYLIASFMVGTLFAYLNFRTWQRRAVFIAFSIVTPIVANWFRAYGIVMLGHLSGNKLAVGVDHIIYGWVFFGLVVVVMFWLGGRFADSEPGDLLPSGPAVTSGAGGMPRQFVLVVLAASVVILVPRWIVGHLFAQEAGRPQPAMVLPAQLAAGWVAEAEDESIAPNDPRFESYKAVFNAPSAEARRIYKSERGRVGVQVAYYRKQDDERKLITSVNVLSSSYGKVWNAVGNVSAQVEADGRVTDWRGVRLKRQIWATDNVAPLTVWRTYWIDGHWLASDSKAKLLGSWSRLQGHGDDAAGIVIWVQDPEPERASALLQQFVGENAATLNELLRGVQTTP